MRRVAHVVHEILGELGATGWPKTSGGNGLHVYVRIEPRWGFAELRRAAYAFAREVERRAPGDVTTTWWRKDRDPPMLFVDYNQNASDHTIASAYSVRGVPEATVSTPITWDEIDDVDPGSSRSPPCLAGSPSSATCTRASTIPSTRWTRCSNGRIATASTERQTFANAHLYDGPVGHVAREGMGAHSSKHLGGVRIIVTGGGTGGHTYPALTTIRELRTRFAGTGVHAEFLWVGVASGLEAKICHQEHIPFKAITTGKLRRSPSPRELAKNLADAFRIPMGVLQAFGIVLRARPDVVLSTGGYVLALGGALSTQIWSTASRVLWSHTWQIFLFGVVAYLLLSQEKRAARGRPIVLATLMLWAYFSSVPTSSIPIAAISIYMLIFGRKEFVAYAITSAIWMVGFIVYSWTTYGSLLPDYYRFHLSPRRILDCASD